MDGFTAGMDQFLVILQLLIGELPTEFLLPARQKANPAPSEIWRKSRRNLKTDVILETEHAKTRLYPTQSWESSNKCISRRELEKLAVLASRGYSSNLCCNWNWREAFSLQVKDFCQGEHILIHHMHLYRVIYKDKTRLLQEPDFVVSLHRPSIPAPRVHRRKKKKKRLCVCVYTHTYKERRGEKRVGEAIW